MVLFQGPFVHSQGCISLVTLLFEAYGFLQGIYAIIGLTDPLGTAISFFFSIKDNHDLYIHIYIYIHIYAYVRKS